MILIAGGSGRLGAELVTLLRARDERIRVITRNAERARARLGGGVEIVEADARDASQLRPAFDGVDTVISAVTGFGLRESGPAAVDLQANLNLIHAAQAAGVKRFVLLSVHGAAADHAIRLLRMKYEAEQALRASGLEWVIVRPTVFAELWAAIIGDPIVRSGKATVFGPGENPINFVSVRDVAAVVASALNGEPNRVIDVGGPENLTLNEVVSGVAAAAGRTAKARHVPLPVLRVSRVLLQPVRADLAGFVEAAIGMVTDDMTFDPAPLTREFPHVRLKSMTDVVIDRFTQTGDHLPLHLAQGS